MVCGDERRRPSVSGVGGMYPGRGFTSCAKRHRVQSVLFALLTLLAHAGSQEQEGDWCINDEGLDGICRNLRHCPYLQRKANVFNGGGASNPDLCSFGNSGVIVCCPTVTPKTSATAAAQQPTAGNARPPPSPVPRTPSPRPSPPPPAASPAASPAAPAAPGDSDTVVVLPAKESVATRISERKCQEYLHSLGDENLLLRTFDSLSDTWCPYPPGNELIVGGLTANSGEYPHMAALGYLIRRQVLWLCGGSLISHSYVLTAAHCLRKDLGLLIAVNLGSLQVTNMSVIAVKRMMQGAGKNSNIYPVAESLRHPKFSRFSHYDDIALIRLDVPVRSFDLYVRPACLHAGSDINGIETAVACGFGHTEYKDESLTRLLRHVRLKVYSSEVCSEVFSAVIQTAKLSRGIVDSQMCAGELAGGKDTCEGDSGGPLQMRDRSDKCIIRIIGVTSFGTALCGSENTAALYTSVAHYLPWIESVVWPSP